MVKPKRQDPSHGEHGAPAAEHLADDPVHGKELLRHTHDGNGQHGDDAAPEQALHTRALGGVSVSGNGEHGQNGDDQGGHGNKHVLCPGLCTARWRRRFR